MRSAVVDPEIEEVVDLWCETFTVGNYPHCKALALELVRRTSFDRDPDQFLFAQKSLAQSLHFLGQHDEAREIAVKVKEYPIGEIATTTVHPQVSMGVVLARIAALKGNLTESAAYLREVTDYARTSNQIGMYQVLALATIPIAFWRADGIAAAEAVEVLRDMSERGPHSYWMGWAANAKKAVMTVFGDQISDDHHQICFDQLDPKQADHLATLDGRFISDIASTRALSGACGWTVVEVTRMRALSLSWFDPAAAAQLIDKAKELARASGVLIWNGRIRQTAEEITARAVRQACKYRAAG
jgi:ATP/maltotriose-dependent transcriptional regulator MalT